MPRPIVGCYIGRLWQANVPEDRTNAQSFHSFEIGPAWALNAARCPCCIAVALAWRPVSGGGDGGGDMKCAFFLVAPCDTTAHNSPPHAGAPARHRIIGLCGSSGLCSGCWHCGCSNTQLRPQSLIFHALRPQRILQVLLPLSELNISL